MTEAEWLGCDDLRAMVDWLVEQGTLTDRKQRLLDCACVRRLWHLLTDDTARRAVEMAERFADGTADADELRETQADALRSADAAATVAPPGEPNSYPALAAAAGAAWEYREGADPLGNAATALSWHRLSPQDPSAGATARGRYRQEREYQITLLHDIVGNPFRPVAADPSWLTSTAVGLAETIYAERAFDRLPILADALEDAGCDHADLLGHLRGPGPHARGCWAVDLVLGKR